MRLERPANYASFGQAEAGVQVTPDVTRLALGMVNAYLVGEAGGPWVLVDAGERRKDTRRGAITVSSVNISLVSTFD